VENEYFRGKPNGFTLVKIFISSVFGSGLKERGFKMSNQVNAIGLYCKECDVPVDIHHAYLDRGVMYIQGDCPVCATSVRFSTDELLISLLRVPQPKGNGAM